MTAMREMDEFDVLLDDVLRTMANPEVPERVRLNVRAQVWVRESAPKRSAVVFSPALFQERMNPKRDAKSTAMALLVHAAAILLVFWLTAMHVQFAAPINKALITALTPPPPMAPMEDRMGGGGGQRGPTPVTKGALPKFADQQITPPAKLQQPKIKMPDATLEVQKDLKMADSNLPNLGMPNSPLLGNSMGNGSGSGLGSGNGSGLGPGSGGGYGGGLRRIGGGVSSPVVIYQVEPEFSEEARKAKFMGIVTVNLIVDTKGMPQYVHVIRGVGMGLDQKAVDAVRQYRFKPAIADGKAVPVELNVQVDFQIF